MSDVEVIEHTDIVRREVDRESNERALAVMDPSILDTLFASRDPNVIVKRIADVSDVLMEAVHQRDLARRYGDNKSEFLHIEAWQFLSSMLGMTVVGIASQPLPDGSGYQAWAELRHVATGRVLGAQPGMCQRTEPGKAKVPDNTLLRMANIRAARAAARSVIGFVPRIGGFEISDPEGPITNDQLGLLHQLEREIGMSHDEGHATANVESYKLLNREDASTLIDRWTAIRDEMSGPGSAPAAHDSSRDKVRPGPDTPSDAVSGPSSFPASENEESPGDAGGEAVEPGDPSPSSTTAPASTEAWERAARAGVTAAKAKAIAKGLGFSVKSAADLTGEQLAKIVARVKDSVA